MSYVRVHGGWRSRRCDPTNAGRKCLAEENGESADALLTRELHGRAFAHRERLGASIAGFAEAVNWPFPEERPQG